MSPETVQVSMRLQPETLQKVERLQSNASLSTPADAVRLGVELGLMVTDALRRGQRVLIETGPDEWDRIVVPQIGGNDG